MERSIKRYAKIGKSSQELFKTIVQYIYQYLPSLGESGSEVSHFSPKPRNFAEVTEFSDDIKKPWLKHLKRRLKYNQQS